MGCIIEKIFLDLFALNSVARKKLGNLPVRILEPKITTTHESEMRKYLCQDY